MSPTKDTMNCKDYNEALLTDPGFEDESGHLESCASCQALAAEISALDGKIKSAMEIDVPELRMPELPDIETGNVASIAARRSWAKPAWFALAATVVLAAFIGVRMTGMNATYGTLEEQVLAHIDHEPGALQISNTPVTDRRLERAVPRKLANMNHDAGLITYAQSCSINGKSVPHLVIQGEHGPITILLMPDEFIESAKVVDGQSIQGVILPVGNGSIAIVGSREERLDRVKQNVLDSVMWST